MSQISKSYGSHDGPGRTSVLISDDMPISVGNLKALIPQIVARGGRSLRDIGVAL